MRGQRGAALTLVALLMPALLVLAGVIVDGGFLVRQYFILEGAAKAAALAATDAYDRDIWRSTGQVVIRESEARDLAHLYLSRNLPAARLESFELPPGTTDRVTLTAVADVPLFFMRILGQEGLPLTATASARRAPAVQRRPGV